MKNAATISTPFRDHMAPIMLHLPHHLLLHLPHAIFTRTSVPSRVLATVDVSPAIDGQCRGNSLSSEEETSFDSPYSLGAVFMRPRPVSSCRRRQEVRIIAQLE